MHLFQQFIQYNRDLHMPVHQHWLLAVSGGVDSVVLCALCRQAGISFSIAHCNFKLRGEESDRDQQFTEQLAKQYEVPFFCQSFDTVAYAAEQQLSIQVAARNLRYQWFHSLINEAIENKQPKTWLVTAHHLDDNIETMLMNFCKGTGIAGIRGIVPIQEKLLRPLLFADRQSIQHYATMHQLSWVEDSSNASDKYTRNYFRHQVIPVIEKSFPEFRKNMLHNAERLRDVEMLYQQSLQRHLKKLLHPVGNEIHIPVLLLQKTPAATTILFEATKSYGFTPHQLKDMYGLMHATNGKYVQSATHRIFRNRNWLVIAPLQNKEAHQILIENSNSSIEFTEGKLLFQTFAAEAYHIPSTSNVAVFDASSIQFPLLLRKWKQGDYFYPLGMTKKKKISKFLMDKKLSRSEKESVWVLEMDKKIVWVIGQRIDNRFKLNVHSKEVMQIEWVSV